MSARPRRFQSFKGLVRSETIAVENFDINSLIWAGGRCEKSYELLYEIACSQKLHIFPKENGNIRKRHLFYKNSPGNSSKRKQTRMSANSKFETATMPSEQDVDEEACSVVACMAVDNHFIS